MSSWNEAWPSWRKGSPPSRTEMILATGPVSASFEEIKRELDRACSYMIFETRAGITEESEFSAVLKALPRLQVRIRGWKVYRDRVAERALLVVKIDPDRTDRIMQELMSLGLPENITCYAYGSRPFR